MAAVVGQVHNIGDGKRKKNYKVIGTVLIVISFLFIMGAPDTTQEDVEDCFSGMKTPAELGFETCADAKDDESGDTLFMSLWCLTCLPGMIFLGLGLKGRNKQNQLVVVQAQTAVQPVMMQPVIQQPVVHQQVAQPMQTAGAMKAQFEQDKKLEHLKIAQQREMARDYDGAIREYEAAGEFTEAGRVRSLMQSMGQSNQAAPVQVNIGQVGNSVVQDSVVMANQQPSPQAVATPQQAAAPVSNNICRHCSAAITPGWQYCPSCNNPVS
jgi:hypothetical protein